MKLFELSKDFPKAEMYSLTDQARRSSRSVSTNIAEAWAKRRYSAAFVSKLSDAEAELYETQAWLDFAVECEYLGSDAADKLQAEYESLARSVVGMIQNADKWCLKKQ